MDGILALERDFRMKPLAVSFGNVPVGQASARGDFLVVSSIIEKGPDPLDFMYEEAGPDSG